MKLRSSIMGLVALTAIGVIPLLGGCGSTVTISHHGWKGSWTFPKTFALSLPTNTRGISQGVLNSSYGTAAKLVVSARSSIVPPADMVNMVVQSFDPSELSVQVAVQGGHLAGASGVVRLKVLNAAGKVLATKDAAYAINGNTLYLQNPGALKSWLRTHGSALVKEGANGIRVAANLPMIRNPNAPSVHLMTTIKYNGTLIGSITGNFRGLRGLHRGCGIVGVHCKVQ